MEQKPIPKIVYEDDDILVIDKPAGLVVHEGAGKEEWTVEKWLLHRSDDHRIESKNKNDYCSSEVSMDIETKSRTKKESLISIIHRLDKDTSGLMIIAKTQEAVENLKNQFAQRQVKKEYTTLVLGRVEPSRGVISGKIGRSPKNRQKMAVLYLGQGREARTRYEVAKYFNYPSTRKEQGDASVEKWYSNHELRITNHGSSRLPAESAGRSNNNILSFLKVFPETGRTHQIRVHLKHFGYPVIGDQKYNTKISKKISKDLGLTHQFLHASQLEFRHPEIGKWMAFKSNLPENLTLLLTGARPPTR